MAKKKKRKTTGFITIFERESPRLERERETLKQIKKTQKKIGKRKDVPSSNIVRLRELKSESEEKIKSEEKTQKRVERAGKLAQGFMGFGTRTFGGKMLKKPKAKMPSTDPKKFITMGSERQALVREGRTGFFKPEEMEDRVKWI